MSAFLPISKRQQQLIRSLHQKKFRQELRLFLAEGEKIVTEALLDRGVFMDMLVASPLWLAENASLLRGYEDRIFSASNADLERITALNSPSPVMAILRQWPDADLSHGGPMVVYCDGISDPGNLGTIIRTAGWFGYGVCCSPDCADVFNPKTIQSTMGAIFRTPIGRATLSELRAMLPKHHVYGADLHGENVLTLKCQYPAVIVVGSESHGIRPDARACIDTEVTIPGQGGTESLNAAVAAGIICAAFSGHGA